MNVKQEVLDKISILAGSLDAIRQMPALPSKKPFDGEAAGFLSLLSKILMEDKRSREFSDVAAFAFWIRGSSLRSMKEAYDIKPARGFRLGRGTAFHIAPSNVPVNFAYSLASGLIAGNANIVRVPGRSFPQVEIIADAVNKALDECRFMLPYISLVRYGRNKEINDWLSSIADIRIIWGGDGTVAELRKSPLPPRAVELAFADRYSIAVIDAQAYLAAGDKKRIAEAFYNDTYFSDQNACTSPRAVIWHGEGRERAKGLFWKELHGIVRDRYRFHAIQAVDKLAGAYMAASLYGGIKIIKEDNLIVRAAVTKIDGRLMDCMGSGGFFFEYDCSDVMELRELCDDRRCQTIGIIGDKAWLMPLFESGIKGADRVADIGRTMDFGLIWDGYDLINSMSRAAAF